MKVCPILFKKTTTGATQVWYVEYNGAFYHTCSGQQNGKIVISEDTQCFPKNIGKANETTAEQQCELEVAALYKKKLAQGNYKESIDDIETDNYFKPMLAKVYSDYVPTNKMFGVGVVSVSPKLDGARMIACRDGLFSRQGKPITSVPHIAETLKPFFDEYPDLILDGELYNHDLKDDFNKIMSLIRKSKSDSLDLEESKKYIQYWIYDLYSEEEYSQRQIYLSELFFKFKQNNPESPLKIVKGIIVHSEEKLNELHAKCIEQGFEGSMIRIDGFPYENKRVNHLLKKKDFLDADYPIVRIEEGVGNRSGMAGSVVYRAPDGSEFGSGIAGGESFYRDLWEHRSEYEGGVGTVKYFQLTPKTETSCGVPRFPVTIKVYKGLRDL